MIEVNENTSDHIKNNKRDFGPELEELKQIEMKDIVFYLKYYRSLVITLIQFLKIKLLINNKLINKI